MSLMRIKYLKLRSMAHLLSLNVFIALNETYFCILFDFTAAGFVPYGGRVSPYINHSAVYI